MKKLLFSLLMGVAVSLFYIPQNANAMVELKGGPNGPVIAVVDETSAYVIQSDQDNLIFNVNENFGDGWHTGHYKWKNSDHYRWFLYRTSDNEPWSQGTVFQGGTGSVFAYMWKHSRGYGFS